MFSTEQGRSRATGSVAALILLIGIFFLGTAQADPNFKAEFAAGQCRAQKSPDGMWHQMYSEGLENASKYKDNNCAEIGLAWDLTPRYGMSVRWVNLGHYSTSARAITCPEDDCKLADRSALFRPECAQKDLQNCVALWNGGGGIHGINLAVNTELARLGPLSLDGELGVFVYEMFWSEQVYPITCGGDHSNCAFKRDDVHESGLYMSPMGSLTLRWKGFFLASRIYARTTEHTNMSPGYSGYVQTWLAGVQIKF